VLSVAAWAALLALVVLAASAPAATPRYPMKAEQTVRTFPSTQAGDMGTVWNGELVEVHCQDQGTSVGGSTLWDYIQYQVDGTDGLVKRGWVPNYYVKTGTNGPLPGVRQGTCPPPLTVPGLPVPPPPVADGPAPTGCETTPESDALQLKVGVRKGKSNRAERVVTTPYRKRVKIKGKLTTPLDAPVPGAPICVAARPAIPGSPLNPRARLVTDSGGSFAYRPRRGPSRRIWFVHPTSSGAVAESVYVRVRARVSLRPSRRSLRNGQTLFLRGRVHGRPHRRGVLVELQARRGNRWQTFETTRTVRSGRFSAPYTFTRTYGVQRYKLRARVPAQRSYPYAAGTTRAVKVKVVGD
jgi:hypothetical protein